jgi:hypothetical protein
LQYFPPSKPRRHALSEAAKKRWWEKYNTEKLRDLIAEHELLRYGFSEEIVRAWNENMIEKLSNWIWHECLRKTL